jgi:molecular chaperone DnaK
MDRIVLIGGPSKMPFIRERVPRELGIPPDLSTDPMTAVAIGAAIFAESRDWSGEASTRKAGRATVSAAGTAEVRYDHPTRTSEDTVSVRLRIGGAAEGHTVQIDAPTGWTSGRVGVRDGVTIKLPVGDHGENSFRATLFDVSGKPLGVTILKVVRTYASAAGIPATQTLAVKVRDRAGGSRNMLDPLVTKGTLLPVAGSKEYVAAHDLEAAVPGSIELEVFQDEGAPDPDLNLAVGLFQVAHSDLPDGARVRKGDKVVFHWRMDDSGLLNGSVELPSVRQTFETRRFYVDQAGHRSFEGVEGSKLATSVLDMTRDEIGQVREAVGEPAMKDLEHLEERLSRQQRVLETAATADERRAVTEEGRHIRQEISRLRNRPEHRGKILEATLAELRKVAEDRHLASDKTAFDRLIGEGTKAMNENDIDQLRRVVSGLFDVRIQVGGGMAIDRLASVYRG